MGALCVCARAVSVYSLCCFVVIFVGIICKVGSMVGSKVGLPIGESAQDARGQHANSTGVCQAPQQAAAPVAGAGLTGS